MPRPVHFGAFSRSADQSHGGFRALRVFLAAQAELGVHEGNVAVRSALLAVLLPKERERHAAFAHFPVDVLAVGPGAGKRRRNTGEKEVPEVPVGLFLSALPRHPVFPSLAEHSRHGVARASAAFRDVSAAYSLMVQPKYLPIVCHDYLL